MSLKTKLLIAGGGLLVVILIVVAILMQAAAERDRKRGIVASAIRGARDALEQNELDVAVTRAERAKKLVRRYRSDLVDAGTDEKTVSEITRLARARIRITGIFTADARMSEMIADARKALKSREISGDPDLRKEIHKRLDERLGREARRLAKVAGRGRDELDALIEFVETAKKHVSKEVAARMQKAVDDAVALRRKKERERAMAIFDRLAETLNQGRFDEAFGQLESEKESLVTAADDNADRLLHDYKQVIAALKTGKNPPATSSFQIKAGSLPAVKQFFMVRELISDWRGRKGQLGIISAWPNTQRKLRSMRQPNPGLAQYAVRELAKVVNRNQELFMFLARKSSLRGSKAKQREAILARLTLSAAMGRLGIAFDRRDFHAGEDKLQSALTVDGSKVRIDIPTADFGKTLRLISSGYHFHTPWTYMLCNQVCWSATLGRQMREAKVDPGKAESWQLIEGPGMPVAVARAGGKVLCFWDGGLYTAPDLAGQGLETVDAYRKAAMKLHRSIEEDDGISHRLRMAVGHLLNGTYGQTDPEDYVDGDFCRQVIMGPYLEKHLPGLSAEHKRELRQFRKALHRVIHGRPVFSFTTGDGARVTALRSLKADLGQGSFHGGDKDAENARERAHYSWMIKEPGNNLTRFAQPMPSRQGMPLLLVNVYSGQYEQVPDDRQPQRVEVRHTTDGLLAWCNPADGKLHGEPEKWDRAVAAQTAGFSRPGMGPPGWGFPIHVPVYDSLGKPMAVVTRYGKIESPDFSGIRNAAERKAAEDKWLDRCARVLPKPGEAALFFKHLAKYCSDSPINEDPEMIGRKKALGDFHQTVYQLLDRKVAGFFLGDCDDMAEFFQVLTRRQGKNSHVLLLPGHAACGYVDVKPLPDGKKQYSFIILQTGPAEIFTGTDFAKTLEQGERSFDRNGSMNFNPEALGFLIRFAGDDTRKPYSLSGDILLDPEYAKTMIKVQSYWFYNYFSTALRTMKKILKARPTPGNYNEVFGLYRMVGLYDRALNLYEKHMKHLKSDDVDRLSNILKAATLYEASKQHDRVLSCIKDVEDIIRGYFQNKKWRALSRTNMIRIQAAGLLSREKRFVRALNMVGVDLQMQMRQLGTLSDPLLYCMLGIYGGIREKEEEGKKLAAQEVKIRDMLDKLLMQVVSRNYFKPEDDFNKTLGRYALLGAYAVMREGRETAIKKLTADGPYPQGERNHAARKPGITEEDWSWFRVCPPVAWSLASEMLNPRKPKKFNPDKAMPLLDAMSRGYANALKNNLGSLNRFDDLMLQAALCRAFVKKDRKVFEKLLANVRGKKKSAFYGTLADMFGSYCGLLSREQVVDWFELFHKYIEGKQYYFQAAYAAVRSRNYDQGLAIANASARYFPDIQAMQKEARAIAALIPRLKQRDARIGDDED